MSPNVLMYGGGGGCVCVCVVVLFVVNSSERLNVECTGERESN